MIEEAADLMSELGGYVLIDEMFLPGSSKERPSSWGPDNVVITSSMTKVFGLGGLRTGWVIAPPEIAKKCQRAKALTSAAACYLGERASAQALNSAGDGLVARFKRTAEHNLPLVEAWVRENEDLVRWSPPDGGMMCFPRYRDDMPSTELCTLLLLRDHGVLVVPGEYFGLDGHFRLTFVNEEEKLRQGLEALGRGLRNILG